MYARHAECMISSTIPNNSVNKYYYPHFSVLETETVVV